MTTNVMQITISCVNGTGDGKEHEQGTLHQMALLLCTHEGIQPALLREGTKHLRFSEEHVLMN